MSTAPSETKPVPQPRKPRGRMAGMVLLLTLVAVAIAWFWTKRQGAMQAEIAVPYIMAAGGTAFIAALLSEFRNMSVLEILEAFWDMIVGLFSLVGSMIKGLFNGILSLLGWD